MTLEEWVRERFSERLGYPVEYYEDVERQRMRTLSWRLRAQMVNVKAARGAR